MDYTVTIDVGAGAWTTTIDSRTPAPDIAEGVWVLDDFGTSWSMPEDKWPAQPEPEFLRLKLLSVVTSALPPMDIGTPVSVQVTGHVWGEFFEYHPTLGTFEGRISDPSARTTTVDLAGLGRVPALEVDLACTGYLADLAELYVGAPSWPAENANDRMAAIAEAAGITWAPGMGVGESTFDAFDHFRALDVDNQKALDVLDDHLRQLATAGNLASASVTGWSRMVVVPYVSDGTWPVPPEVPTPAGTVQWMLTPLYERVMGTGGPLVLQQLDNGKWGLAADPNYGSNEQSDYTAVRSSVVDAEVEWRRSKGTATNRVLVSGEFAGIFGEFGPDLSVTSTVPQEASFPDLVAARGPITEAYDSTLRYVHSARLMASMYLGDREDRQGRWAVNEFTFYADEMTDGDEVVHLFRLPQLFPNHRQGIPQWGVDYPYGAMVVLYGLQEAHQLGGRDWTAGYLVGATLTIRNRRLAVTLTLRTGVSLQGYSTLGDGTTDYEPLTPAALRLKYPTLSPADMDPSVTYYDLRLTRSE